MEETSILQGHRRQVKLAALVTAGVRSMPSVRARGCFMKRREGMSSVLDGVRVIDFGQYIAGPLTAMLLADQGADVIRVDPPGGPLWETPANATWNRGKRSIALHLKQPDALALATRLIASADVMIE